MTGKRKPGNLLVLPGSSDLPAAPQPASLPGSEGNLYQAVLPVAQLADFEQARRARLNEEIALLRLVMRQVVAQTQGEQLTLEAWQETLNALSLAAVRLARLVEIERELASSEDNSLAVLALAIHKSMKEKGW